MYIIKTEQRFDSAHFLSGYQGKCSNLHGHCWRVIIEVSQENLNMDTQTRGMIADFGSLKADLKELCDYMDHCLIIEEGTLKKTTYDALIDEGFRIVNVPFRPTAENLAKYFYDKMNEKGYCVHRSIVYETENNCAQYSKEGYFLSMGDNNDF
ncbi:MAG: 6-carboxytetrahydropterin synthase QueD [Lachnospiraceae bacterium]|nr:6-carboxytetrahydropterin synthase QueD [Lachnospiraceae bacterium]